ncbi:MAG: DNA mismatch repair protein MutS, partial [Clostridiales bacterium]|nr:DNA mismatch repair protein MutS [Clostridiales bacterium]
ILRNNSHCFSESFVSNRNGHFTLVVRKEYKNQIKGSVIDISNSKGSYVIEPESVEKLQKEMHLLHLEEENEIVRILYTLTGLVDDNLTNIKINIEAMHTLDFVFAKAKLSIAMSATPATITIDRKMNITQGRHPLINQDEVIPLDFKLGSDNKKSTTHGIIITGPNTGGKTVVIKTVGLFSVMSQCGLHIPAKEATICMHNMVLCDIGDGQSITENLSTFSSHMTNIIEILSIADMHSLVLLDELGSGTDPTEGMGLATVILEELNKKKCMLVATTHYPEIKEFAHNTPGFINAKMAFDRQNMLPLYQLEIGEAGESCALYIAKRLGLPQQMISRAYAVAYHESKQQKKSISIAHDDFDIISERDMTTQKKVPKIIAKRIQPVAQKAIESKFTVGDSVRVFPSKQIGIVYQKADIKGDVGVRIREKNHLVNHKRIKLVVSAKELYPDNYDMDVVLDTKDNRKAKKKIARKGHNPDLVINIKQGYDSKD